MEGVVTVTGSTSFSLLLLPDPLRYISQTISLSLLYLSSLSPAVASDCDVALVYEAEGSLHYISLQLFMVSALTIPRTAQVR